MISFVSQLGIALLCVVGSVDGNTDWPESPRAYTVVAFPANYQTDPLSQDIINGFQADATLKELRARTKVWTYDENDADWQHRFAPMVAELPTVIVMDGDKVVYKRSKANTQTLAHEIRTGGLFNRFPQCNPNDPNCPNRPNQPSEPSRPNRPSRPSVPPRPLIPDTGPVLPTPPQPTPADDTKLKELTARIEVLEKKIAEQSVVVPKQGRDGKDGADGKPGRDGVNGKDGAAGQPGKDAVLNLDALAATVASKLPPITFERLDQNGKVLDSIDVHLGKKASFPPLTVNYLDGTGKVLDKEFVPLGGTLNLRIEK